MGIRCRSYTLIPEVNVSNGDKTYYYNSYLFMYMVIKPGGVTIFLLSLKRTVKSIFGHIGWLHENHVQSNSNLFHVDKASRDGGRRICLWKLSRRGVLFKHEWASDSREDNTRGLIITTEYNNGVVALKSPSRGVILDLIKCCVNRFPGLLLIAIPFAAAFVGLAASMIPHWDPEWLRVIQLTTCVS